MSYNNEPNMIRVTFLKINVELFMFKKLVKLVLLVFIRETIHIRVKTISRWFRVLPIL